MPLTLTDQDINELQQLMDDMLMRPRDGSRLVAFFTTRQIQQAQAAQAPKPAANGKAEPAEATAH